MSSHSAYSNAPLKNSERCIRLVEILDNGLNTSISCRFHCHPISSCPPYTALSYTWVLPGAFREIHLEGEPFFVRENLGHFLEQERAQKRWKYLWIDAICIDQSKTRERNNQVGMMRDIYTKVSRSSTRSRTIKHSKLMIVSTRPLW